MTATLTTKKPKPIENFKVYFQQLSTNDKLDVSCQIKEFLGKQIEPLLMANMPVQEPKTYLSPTGRHFYNVLSMLKPTDWKSPKFHLGQTVWWKEKKENIQAYGAGLITGMDYFPDTEVWGYSVDVTRSLYRDTFDWYLEEDLNPV